jgi:putative ABC transport system substrate-binding protein
MIFILLFTSDCTESSKIYKVGILCGLDFFANTADGFKTKMTELGYIEGKNIIYDFHKTNYNPVEEKNIINKFVAEKVDLIFTFPTEVSLVAKTATQDSNIPVLFANAFIEGVDLVNNIRQPGGNITGVRFPGLEVIVKRFNIMLELVPKTKRIWICYQQNYPTSANQMEVLRTEAAKASIKLIVELKLTKEMYDSADPQLIRLCFQNLFDNAIKFTKNNEITIIEVGFEIKDNSKIYFVKDNGVGFDKKYSSRLHSPEEFPGTGVGLKAN